MLLVMMCLLVVGSGTVMSKVQIEVSMSRHWMRLYDLGYQMWALENVLERERAYRAQNH